MDKLPLAGYKTYITAGIMLVIAVAEAAGVPIPGFNADPGSLIATAVGLIFARVGATNAAKAGIVIGLLLIGGHAFAADLKAPAKVNPFTGYVAGGCGMYFGINTMGSAGYVNGGVPGASIVQGDIGGTLGYGCPIGTTAGNFWFVEGNFDFANVNGGTSGLALTGPAHFEQRVALGSPISSMLNLFPQLSTLSVPALPALPAGVTAGNVYPFLFASLHEQDISAQVSLDQNRQWLVSPGIGIGMETRLSNGVVAETAAQWVLQSNGLGVGPSTVRLGNAAEVSFTLKY